MPDNDSLDVLCQEVFAKEACQKAHVALNKKPWSVTAVAEACKHLETPSTLQATERVESLLLLRSNRLGHSEQSEIRHRLDISLRKKQQDQPYVQLPPYGGMVQTTTPKPPATTATTTVHYRGPAASPYAASTELGEVPNADYEDTTMWCGTSTTIKATDPECTTSFTG